MPKKPYDPCKINACRIQTCLKENHYQEEKCYNIIEEMRQCCLKFQNKVSLCCEGIDLQKEYKTPEPKKSSLNE